MRRHAQAVVLTVVGLAVYFAALLPALAGSVPESFTVHAVEMVGLLLACVGIVFWPGGD